MDDLIPIEIYPLILELEQKDLVTRTFRRLDPNHQRAIIAAILAEAGERGPALINIKRVAERAEVSTGSLYQYFNSRQGLLDFAIELVVHTTTQSFGSTRPYFTEMTVAQAISVYLAEGIAWSQAEAGFTRFFATAAYHGDPELGECVVRPIGVVLLDLIRTILTQGAERNEIRADLDLEATVRVVNALLIAVGDAQLLPYLNTYYQLYGEDVPPERVMTALFDFIKNGLGIKTV